MSNLKSTNQTFSSLTKVHIENFKSLEKTSLDLAPLTVLIGANSRGKSSILQSILVVAQSVGKTKLGQVSLNGEAVSLGTSDEVFRKSKNGKPHQRASIGIEVSISNSNPRRLSPLPVFSRISEQFNFNQKLGRSRKGVLVADSMKQTLSRDGKSDQVENLRLHEELSSALGRPVFKLTKGKRNPAEKTRWHSRDLSPRSIDSYLIGLGRGGGGAERAHVLELLQLLIWTMDDSGLIRLNHPYRRIGSGKQRPELVLSKKDLSKAIRELTHSFHEALLGKSIPIQESDGTLIRYLPRVDRVVSEWILQEKNDEFSQIMDHLKTDEARQLLTDFALGSEFMKEKFLTTSYVEWDEVKEKWSDYLSSSVLYLGPLREKDAPSDVGGKLQYSMPSPFGSRAEFLADFLFDNKDLEILFPTPSQVEPKRQKLLEALECWAGEYFQLGAKITVGEEGLSGPVIRVSGNRLLNLGTGVSQILPVIALCLLATPGSTVILEQPELHLHPGLQRKLGTFLTLVASTGRQVIVETHSEYLLTRVRRHIAEGHIPEQSCTLVFVQDDGNVIQREALSGGDAEEWPEQFLDHSLDDAIAIATLREKQ